MAVGFSPNQIDENGRFIEGSKSMSPLQFTDSQIVGHIVPESEIIGYVKDIPITQDTLDNTIFSYREVCRIWEEAADTEVRGGVIPGKNYAIVNEEDGYRMTYRELREIATEATIVPEYNVDGRVILDPIRSAAEWILEQRGKKNAVQPKKNLEGRLSRLNLGLTPAIQRAIMGAGLANAYFMTTGQFSLFTIAGGLTGVLIGNQLVESIKKSRERKKSVDVDDSKEQQTSKGDWDGRWW